MLLNAWTTTIANTTTAIPTPMPIFAASGSPLPFTSPTSRSETVVFEPVIGNYKAFFACLRDESFHFFLVAEFNLDSSLFTGAAFGDLSFDLRNPRFVSLRIGKDRIDYNVQQ
jgi:hypothetical protein